jgi:hypothetical protein
MTISATRLAASLTILATRLTILATRLTILATRLTTRLAILASCNRTAASVTVLSPAI